MTPEKSRVFIVHDDPDAIDTLTDYLANEGHEVVLTANSLDTGLTVVQKTSADEVDVGLFDDNLVENDEKNHDGAIVAKAFRDKFPDKPLFSISMRKQEWSDDPSLTGKSGSATIAKKVTKA